jgi:8-oxo-dGTP diphosphatase
MDDPTARFSRALSAAGALFFDDEGRILLLQPTYKPGWEIPGGYIEVGETPTQACAREVNEELGLTVEPGRILVVDWAPHVGEGDKVLFVFDGGVLDPAAIRLDPAEIAGFEFVELAVALDRLIPRLSRRVAAAVDARHRGHTAYLEHGLVVGLQGDGGPGA